jgi:hypothetical protein
MFVHTSLCSFSFVLPFSVQQVNNEVHNVVVLVGIVFEMHVKDVECVRFCRS